MLNLLSWACQGGWNKGGGGHRGEKVGSDLFLLHPENLEGRHQGH